MRVYEYNNLQTFLEVVKAKDSGYKNDEYREDFHDSKSFDEAVRIANEGRNITLEDVKSSEEYQAVTSANGLEMFNDVAGAVVNIGNYLSGDPLNMVNYNPIQIDTQTKILKLNINLTLGYDINTRLINNTAKRLLSAIEYLESKGYAIEINTFVAAIDRGLRKDNKLTFKINTKRSNERLNVSTFYSLISTDNLRRFYFAFVDVLLDRASKNIKKNKGLPITEGLNIPNLINVKDLIIKDTTEIIKQIIEVNK